MTKSFSMSSFIGGVVLGASLVGAWVASSTATFTTTFASSAPSSQTASSSQPESGAVSVARQPSGTTVVVESVTVPPPGVWLAIREVNGAELGNVLGAVRVNGPHTNIEVPLLRATQPGLSYAAELYRDDGGTAFNLTRDSVYVDFNTGAPVISYFMTTK